MTLSKEDQDVARRCGVSFGEAQRLIEESHTSMRTTTPQPERHPSHRVAERETGYRRPPLPGENW